VIRHHASRPRDRIGTLFFNPGGPVCQVSTRSRTHRCRGSWTGPAAAGLTS
jgi:hypothetical protein